MDENTATATPESIDWKATACNYLDALIFQLSGGPALYPRDDVLAFAQKLREDADEATAWQQMLADDARLLEELRRNSPVEE